jgi:hypothetical protein
MVGLVKAMPEAGLFALLANWLNLMAGHIGHQQLHGIGANIDDGAADGFHGASLARYRAEARPLSQAGDNVLAGAL